MDVKVLRFLAFGGIILSLLLSIWYTIKSRDEGNPKWIYLMMFFGICILLVSNLIDSGRRKD